jgi:hypothetical protein
MTGTRLSGRGLKCYGMIPEKWAPVFRQDHAQSISHRQIGFDEVEPDLPRGCQKNAQGNSP